MEVSGRLVTHPEPAPLTAQLDREATASKCRLVRALLAISVVWWYAMGLAEVPERATAQQGAGAPGGVRAPDAVTALEAI